MKQSQKAQREDQIRILQSQLGIASDALRQIAEHGILSGDDPGTQIANNWVRYAKSVLFQINHIQ